MSIRPQSLIPDSSNSDSPLSKLKVRQAISCAINREAVLKARGFGYSLTPMFSLTNTPPWFHSYDRSYSAQPNHIGPLGGTVGPSRRHGGESKRFEKGI